MKIGGFVIETTAEYKADKYYVRRIMQITHSKVSNNKVHLSSLIYNFCNS